MDGNYIKLSRGLLDWEWYTDINTTRLFIHMLLKANWKDGNFKGTTVPRGSFVSSIGKLSSETGLTEREIRTAISHLKKTGEVTSKTTNKFTVFTVVKYDLYQTSDKQNDRQETSKRQSNDILTPTIEEKKEGKKGRNTPPISPVEQFEEFSAAYPKQCTGYLVETEYCNAVLAGVPEDDLVLAAQNYADTCRREKTAERYIKKPENWLRENLFMQYLKGEDHGSTGRNTGTHEKSLNELMQERGDTGEFQGF
ncbi:hypothetical protein [Roseburia sp.]|uniref:hypothetical protein n=1 Tax=Roseburia sp. TaxID=2049040 RepID=UPI0035217893